MRSRRVDTDLASEEETDAVRHQPASGSKKSLRLLSAAADLRDNSAGSGRMQRAPIRLADANHMPEDCPPPIRGTLMEPTKAFEVRLLPI